MNWYKQAKTISKKEILDKADGKWDEYSKFATIWVMSFDNAKKQNIINSEGILNTIEGPQTPSDKDVICRGVGGEYWNQPKSRLEKKYTKLSDENPEGKRGRYYGWTEWKPKGEKVEAYKCKSHDFKIDSMTGKSGDWVLRDKSNHSDVWVVDNELFHKTYNKA